MRRGRRARSTPRSRCSAIAGAWSSSATSSSGTAAISESCRLPHKRGSAKIPCRPAQATRRGGLLTREDARACQRARYSLTEPAIQLVPVFAQLGSWGLRHRPTSSELRVRAELLEQGGPALWQEFMDELRRSQIRYVTAITERSRAPERGLPRCRQLLVAARPSAMYKGADGRLPSSCLTWAGSRALWSSWCPTHTWRSPGTSADVLRTRGCTWTRHRSSSAVQRGRRNSRPRRSCSDPPASCRASTR
jgi:hypothetical protein